jgi:hypothetical protein
LAIYLKAKIAGGSANELTIQVKGILTIGSQNPINKSRVITDFP